MKRSLAWIVAGFALNLAACTANAQPKPSSALTRATGIDLSKACPGNRWIAILRSATKECPISRGYPEPCRLTDFECRVRNGLLADVNYQRSKDPDEEKIRSAALRDAGLDRFCLYDAKGSSATGVPPLPPSDIVRVDRDCRSAASLGSDLEKMTWAPLQTQFLQQTGRAAFTPTPNARKVRLAIVDSQPTGEGPPAKQGCSPHGYTLAQMAQNLVCASPGKSPEECAAKVTTRLAFLDPVGNRRSPETGEICQGGLVGWIGDLAPAILDEIDAWRAKDGEDRLILNLSVGWDPQFFGGLQETSVDAMAAPVQAVYRALVYAAKRGALVVAAAGNATPGPTPHEGPILPAAWEGWTPGAGSKARANPRPLIYAVGGVRWNDYPIPNARPKAMPPRVAYADHGVVRDPAKENGPSAILTGTSVATVVVSSAAALLWTEKPNLSPADLMRSLEDGWGYPIAATAQFGTQPGGKVKRICIGGRASCQGAKSSFSYSPTLDGFAAPTMDASVLVVSALPPAANCPSTKKFLKHPGPPDPPSYCPCDQFESANLQPWVDPQPGSDDCGACTVRGPGPNGGLLGSLFPPLAGAFAVGPTAKRNTLTLYIDISESWLTDTPSLKATTLEVAFSNGDQPALTVQSYSLNQSFSKNGPTSLRVDNLKPPPLLNPIVRSATLNFVIVRDGHPMSISSPLFFSP